MFAFKGISAAIKARTVSVKRPADCRASEIPSFGGFWVLREDINNDTRSNRHAIFTDGLFRAGAKCYEIERGVIIPPAAYTIGQRFLRNFLIKFQSAGAAWRKSGVRVALRYDGASKDRNPLRYDRRKSYYPYDDAKPAIIDA